MRTNGKIAIAIILAMLCTVLFASLLIACGAYHACSGEDCTVCACLNFSEEIARLLVAFVFAIGFAALLTIKTLAFVDTGAGVAELTPITLKVKLLN